jgi:hypothetical protein
VAERTGVPWERWLSIGGSIVAPVTAISTLLFYFGYVSTREQFRFFGLDVDTIGLTTQDYVMRSGQPLLVPVIVLTLLGAAAVLATRRLRPWLVDHSLKGVVIGAAVLLTGVALLLSYTAVGEWVYYPLVTPLVLALGGAVTAYTLGLRAAPVPARVALWFVVAASVFWANATVAQWSGAGLAREQAAALQELPQVVVDTRERLYLQSPDIGEGVLPVEEGQTFRYRYRGWRLLVQNGDRMFLVPCQRTGSDCVWRRGSPTMLIRAGDGTRVQFFAP